MGQSMKKIGEYLVESDLCDESSLEEALKEQAELRDKEVFKLIGTVLKDSQAISQEDLDSAIAQMCLNILSSSTIFQNISDEVLRKMLSKAHLKLLPEGTVIFKQGEKPESFFIVVSGKVKIFKTSSDSQESTITYLARGEGFGEVSLLTGELHSASAKTLKPTNLLEV